MGKKIVPIKSMNIWYTRNQINL